MKKICIAWSDLFPPTAPPTVGYQKLLSWEPLFALESLVLEGVGQGAGQDVPECQYHCGDTVSMRCTFHYNGPVVSGCGLGVVCL